MDATNQLHLPNLTIKGFRGIDELTIPRMGRVTLLTGKNAVGKTTVLDAIQVYAARGRSAALYDLLLDCEEMSATIDEDGNTVFVPDWRALFYGRDVAQSDFISIGPNGNASRLSIRPTILDDEQAGRIAPGLLSILRDVPIEALEIAYGESRRTLPWAALSNRSGTNFVARRPSSILSRRQLRLLADESEWPPVIECESLGPGLLDNSDLARLWDGVALTDDEEQAVASLRLVFGSDAERVAIVGDDISPGRQRRRAVVRLKGHDRPVPLKSLGDGALRLFGVALALANSQGGILLIDEAENGIHYRLQRDFWRMALQAAHENNVQVVATTHSWDCVRGFAQAAQESEDAEGVLVRLSRQYGPLRAVEYSEKELVIAAKHRIEVR